jgi:hypothetical protein
VPAVVWRILPPSIERLCDGEVVPIPNLPPTIEFPATWSALVVALSMVAPPHTSSFERVEVEVFKALPINTWLVDVPRRTPELLKKVQLLSEPLPDPAWSVPQVNWRVAALQSSLSAESEQERSPAPAIVPFIYMLVVVALVDVAFVKTAVEGVEVPIGVFSMLPPVIVSASAICASVAIPRTSAKLIPSVEVAESVYPTPVPTRSCPKVGVEERPVPPYKTPIEVVAETIPLFACKGPLSEPSVKFETTALVALRSEAKRLVEVAFVVVEFMKLAFAKYEVDEAKMPDCAQSAEVVAAVS